jgi:hypothetical protein
MNSVRCDGLNGRNPLAFLAALGTLRLLSISNPAVKLSWTTSEIVPLAVFSDLRTDFDGVRDELVLALQKVWDGPLLSSKADDVKFETRELLRQWLQEVGKGSIERELVMGLVAEGARDGGGKSKPSHLHFSSGQQSFFSSLREAFGEIMADNKRIDEALLGPWRFDSTAKTMGWDAGNERVFALRGFNPSKEKRSGIPAADVLAFIGFTAFPVAAAGPRLLTTGCDRDWKVSALTWPLWPTPMQIESATALVRQRWVFGIRDGRPITLRTAELRARGVVEVVRSPIRRSDQGGYGSFGAATVIASST